MKNNMKTINILSKLFILLSGVSMLYVSLLAFISPQAVMALVEVHLENNDAISSIRGVYGGVGLSIVVLLVYFIFFDVMKGLAFLSVFWSLYAISRVLTIIIDGTLGGFGTQWLIIETVFAMMALTLLVKYTSSKQKKENYFRIKAEG
jgi:hypothetical protein